MTTLVIICRRGDEYIHSRYEGRVCTDIFATVLPLSAYWIEEIRNAPKSVPTFAEPEAA